MPKRKKSALKGIFSFLFNNDSKNKKKKKSNNKRKPRAKTQHTRKNKQHGNKNSRRDNRQTPQKIIAIEDLKIEIIKLQMIENYQMKQN